MSRHVNRRDFLKGLGTAIALPALEKMLPLSALAQTPKQRINRMAYIFVPNGVNMANWTPSATGANFELTPILNPLQNVRSSISVLSGLAQRNAFALGDGPGDHARSTAVWLTGVHPKKTAGADIRNGISADQVAAQKIGTRTKFPSLEIGCERGALAGDCDSGYSCAYSSSISWKSESTPVAKEVNPRAVFERLFGNGDDAETAESRAQRNQTNKSILDYVLEESNVLKQSLGNRDQQKLDEYFQAIRELEVRITRAEKENPALAAGTRPKGVPADYGEHIRLMGDMMILAFQTDLTRICTFMLANDGSNRSFNSIGISEGHHDISHHGKDPMKLEKKKQIDTFYTQQLAYILEKMATIKEPTGTLLDNSMIVYGAGISDGDRHNHDDLPILIAGRGGGTIKTGRHMQFSANTPMNNLFVSMLDRMGVPIESLGDSNGKLSELF
ncbi:MAG: DUF1552 domain-containing protein [Fimbriimonadales bacterium]